MIDRGRIDASIKVQRQAKGVHYRGGIICGGGWIKAWVQRPEWGGLKLYSGEGSSSSPPPHLPYSIFEDGGGGGGGGGGNGQVRLGDCHNLVCYEA